MAVLVPCLVTLRSEFNKIAPNRDKESDGWIGNAAHRKTKSDHNPDKNNRVHAVDVDDDLRVPGLSMEKCVQAILAECRKSGTSGKDRGRLKYIIYEGRIWEASNNWEEEDYDGPNAHDKHAHFSAESDFEFSNDTRPWGLVEKFGDELPVDQVTFNRMFAEALKQADEEFADVLSKAIYEVNVPDYAEKITPEEEKKGKKRRLLTIAQWLGWSDGRADVARVEKQVNELSNKLDKLSEAVDTLSSILVTKPDSRGAVNL